MAAGWAKQAGAEWRALAEQERQPYVDAYAADKVAYEAALQEYVISGSAVAWEEPVSPPKRDPERPKRPATTFFRFLADFRKRHPDERNVSETAKQAGAEWRALAEREKQPYVDAYAADKEAYEAALQEYVRSGKAAAWEERVSPPKRDPERPKRPATTFFRFLADFRKMHPDERNVSETAKQAGAQWRALAEREKQPYVDAYAPYKEAYEEAMQEYMRSGRAAAWEERISPPKRDPYRPKRPPNTFFRFLADFRKRHPDIKRMADMAKQAGAEWRALTEEEKQPYVDAYAADREAYEEAKQEYVRSGKAAAWEAKYPKEALAYEGPKAANGAGRPPNLPPRGGRGALGEGAERRRAWSEVVAAAPLWWRSPLEKRRRALAAA